MAEVSEQEQQPQESLPAQESELEDVLETLDNLAQLCSKVLDEMSSSPRRDELQELLTTYSHGLAYLPKALQQLQDYRRLLPDIEQQSQQTRQRLIKLRGGEEDSLSSEEQRVLSNCEGCRQVIISSIDALEAALDRARQGSAPLLEVVAFEGLGFGHFLESRFHAMGIDVVSTAVNQQSTRLDFLLGDLESLRALQQHAQELEGGRTPA